MGVIELDLAEVARRAREVQAEKIFAVEKVRQAMHARAGRGYDCHRIVLEAEVDLRHTAAARTLLQHLATYPMPVRVKWRQVALADGVEASFRAYELLVVWGTQTDVELKPVTQLLDDNGNERKQSHGT